MQIQTEMEDTLGLLLKEKLPKNSMLKAQAEEALASISKYTAESGDFSAYIAEHKEIGLPFVKGMQELSLKHKQFAPCVSTIHKMITWGCVRIELVPSILEGMERCITAFPEVRLRILQMLLPFVQDPKLVRGKHLEHLIKIGVLLVETSRNQSVNTSKVIVCHVVSIAFERPDLLQEEDRSIAIADCKLILAMSLQQMQKSSTFGLDLLLACVVEGKSGFNVPEVYASLDELVDLLLEMLGKNKVPVVSRALQILLHVLSGILQDKSKCVELLFLVFRADMKDEVAVLREEFTHLLPYAISKLVMTSSAELSDLMFSVKEPFNALKLPPIKALYIKQPNRTELPVCAEYCTALRLSKLFEIVQETEAHKDESPETLHAFLSVLVQHYTKAVYQITDLCIIEKTSPVVASLERACKSLASVSVSESAELNAVSSLVYWLGRGNAFVFYPLAAYLTSVYRRRLKTWAEFFELALHTQEAYPEMEVWKALIKELAEYTTEELQIALKGAADVPGLPPQKHASLFLGLAHRADTLPHEFSQLVRKVFNEEEILATPSLSAEHISFFLGEYFTLRLSARTHEIVLSRIKTVFLEMYAVPEAKPVPREILDALSLGIRVAGENFCESWSGVYTVLLAAMKDTSFHSTVFDIVQVITDRLLPFLPVECLLTTAHILCVCCTLIKESNTSLQTLQCMRELVEYALCDQVPPHVREDVWHVSLCLLCAVAYDARDDVRDSAIAQVFESIYLYREHNCLAWQPLVSIFLKRLLGAAVYAKDKEIYSGEHEEASSESTSGDAHVLGKDACLCKNMGACTLSAQTVLEEKSHKRSVNSTKSMVLSISSMIYEYFEELQKTPGFFSLWSFYGRILIKFSQDPDMERAIVTALSSGLSKIRTNAYWKSFFFTVAEVCMNVRDTSFFAETLIQMIKYLYQQIICTAKQKEVHVFFAAVTALLKQNTNGQAGALSFLEFEAACTLQEEGIDCMPQVRIHTLLKWVRLSQESPEKFSSNFVVLCIKEISLEVQTETFEPEMHKEIVSTLLAYHFFKHTHPQCWKHAINTLQELFSLETKRKIDSQVIWASRNILGISLGRAQSTAEAGAVRNQNIWRAISESDSCASVVKQEEKDMCNYLLFLDTLSQKTSRPLLVDIYHLLLEVQSTSLSNGLPTLYLTSIQVICHVLGKRKELKDLAEKWIHTALAEYNKKIRVQRTGYSRFEREAVSYLLQQILDRALESVSIKDILTELAACITSEDSTISHQAVRILQNAIHPQAC
ncbi:hypothetical protein NECID01_0072 [Nematocida sp. AWRm77]|nr:hypothetical protein NECID01_0072 [Nematocida sp. AWRm77]